MTFTADNSSSEDTHCCEKMKEQIEFVCEIHADKFDCPDNLIFRSKSSSGFGLIIHDGGSSFVKINFCPFCGKSLNND